jgi:hypothetical protein
MCGLLYNNYTSIKLGKYTNFIVLKAHSKKDTHTHTHTHTRVQINTLSLYFHNNNNKKSPLEKRAN